MGNLVSFPLSRFRRNFLSYSLTMKDLTEKQKAFARGVFEGLSQREAYKKAYDCSTKKDKTVDELASRLARNAKVKEYLEEMNKEVEKSAVLSKKERMEWLSRVVTTPINAVDGESDLCQEYTETQGETFSSMKYKMPSKIQAIQELNKMDGAYEPEKIEVKSELSFSSLLKSLPSDPLVRGTEES